MGFAVSSKRRFLLAWLLFIAPPLACSSDDGSRRDSATQADRGAGDVTAGERPLTLDAQTGLNQPCSPSGPPCPGTLTCCIVCCGANPGDAAVVTHACLAVQGGQCPGAPP